jgi:FAD/FMN-containing dehydrogenase
MAKVSISGWGNYPKVEVELQKPTSNKEISAIQSTMSNVIPRGAGRSYGDAALANQTVSLMRMNGTIRLDSENGVITCQAGKMLNEILDEIVPKGFFLPVTPGTKYVTVGGAIAADIHGKNHHIDGCFSNHLTSFELMLANGEIKTCSRTENNDLFWATVGGMGLTGFILEAAFKLKPITSSKINKRTIKCDNLETLVESLKEHEGYTYSVAWIDCDTSGKSMGRGILNLGEHASKSEAEMSSFKTPKPLIDIPFNLPNWTLNQLTVKAFNTLFYAKELKNDYESVVGFETFFYPLDAIGNWNRLYGSNGFVQYQFVIPMEEANTGLHDIMKVITDSGESSFLAVLKLFGEQNDGWLSFPKRGVTLALDFRANDRTFKLLNQLDKMVDEMGGRLYLAKDARMQADFFAKGYRKLREFKLLLGEIDAQSKFRSLQSDRLGIT